MSLSELLCSQRRWGRARSRKLLVSAGLSEAKRVGTLTSRQQRILVGALGGEAGEPAVLIGGSALEGRRAAEHPRSEEGSAGAPAEGLAKSQAEPRRRGRRPHRRSAADQVATKRTVSPTASGEAAWWEL